MEDDLLHMARAVRQYAGAADLGAGAGGGRHSDDRRDRRGVGPRPPIADVFEIPNRTRLACHEGDELANIQARATADGDDTIVVAGAVDRDTGGEVLLARVGIHIGKHGGPEAGRLQNVPHFTDDRQGCQAPVRHEQRPFDAGGGTGVAEFPDAPGTKADGGWIAPVGDQAHSLRLSSDDRISDDSDCGSRSPTGRHRGRCPCSRSSKERDRGSRRGS